MSGNANEMTDGNKSLVTIIIITIISWVMIKTSCDANLFAVFRVLGFSFAVLSLTSAFVTAALLCGVLLGTRWKCFPPHCVSSVSVHVSVLLCICPHLGSTSSGTRWRWCDRTRRVFSLSHLSSMTVDVLHFGRIISTPTAAPPVSLLLREDSVGVLWGLCWKGERGGHFLRIKIPCDLEEKVRVLFAVLQNMPVSNPLKRQLRQAEKCFGNTWSLFSEFTVSQITHTSISTGAVFPNHLLLFYTDWKCPSVFFKLLLLLLLLLLLQTDSNDSSNAILTHVSQTYAIALMPD